MDATITVICYKSKVLKNGESPLMLRVSKDGKRSLKSIGASVNPIYWDFNKNQLKSNCPNRAELTTIITENLSKYQKRIFEDKINGIDKTASEITGEKKLKRTYVEDFLANHIKNLRSIGCVGNSYAYLNLQKTLKNFYGKKLDFMFSSINICVCYKLEAWMRQRGYEDVTMSYYFRTLRALYNKAVEAKCADRTRNPFSEYRLSRFNRQTKKRALPKTDVMKLLTADCSGMKHIAQLAHDVFSFSYYCGGISLVDIANLTPENIVNGRLVYKRQKTHRGINLLILDEAHRIIEKYADYQKDAYYLFPILDAKIHKTPMQKYNRIRKLCGQINRELAALGKQLKIEGNVTTYVARHSFATILKKSGINIGIISQALGHQDLKTTQIYLAQFDDEQVDNAMQYLL